MQKIVSMCIHPCLLKIHISVHTLSLSRSSFYNHSRRSQTREPTEDTFLALPVPLFYYHFCFYFVSLVTTAHYNPSQIPKYKDQGSSLFQLKSCSSCHQEWPNTPWFTVRSLPSSPPSVPGLPSGPCLTAAPEEFCPISRFRVNSYYIQKKSYNFGPSILKNICFTGRCL